jgi:hypothetical protein
MKNINYPKRIRQIHDFTQVKRMRGITPTDIDGLIDYGGRAFIYVEGKAEGAELPKGQRMALENVVNSHIKAGHPSAAFVYIHNTTPDETVYVEECPVILVYSGRGWQETYINILELITKFEEKYANS